MAGVYCEAKHQKLLIERGRQLNREKVGKLNLLQIRQCYLVKKIQAGCTDRLTELQFVQSQIILWHKEACEKIKIQAKCDELNSAENVRIYHYEQHRKQIKRRSILKLETDEGLLEGHKSCADYLEKQVSQLLLKPASLDCQAQQQLLREVSPVFTTKDNDMLTKVPSKLEVKLSVAKANLQAAPGTDGITTYFYHKCWDTIGDAITEVTQAIHKGKKPSLSQRTSLMVFGSEPKKPNSYKPSDTIKC